MHTILMIIALGQFGAPAPQPDQFIPLPAQTEIGRHAPPIQWFQPVQPQPIEYPTPLRNLLFGRTRLAPVGPPVPYRWEPGRWVPLQEHPQ